MFGWFKAAAALASCTNRCMRWRSLANSSGKTLRAMVRSSCISWTRYTSPIPPAPSCARISYRPSRVPVARVIVLPDHLRTEVQAPEKVHITGIGADRIPKRRCLEIHDGLTEGPFAVTLFEPLERPVSISESYVNLRHPVRSDVTLLCQPQQLIDDLLRFAALSRQRIDNCEIRHEVRSLA